MYDAVFGALLTAFGGACAGCKGAYEDMDPGYCEGAVIGGVGIRIFEA